MDILGYNIVKQTNGKFALWNAKDKSFDYQNFESAEKLKARILDKVDTILTDSILSLAMDDTWFKIFVEDFKIENGLDNSPQREAVAILEEMGESAEDF